MLEFFLHFYKIPWYSIIHVSIVNWFTVNIDITLISFHVYVLAFMFDHFLLSFYLLQA